MSRPNLSWSVVVMGLLLALDASPARAAVPKRAVELRDALSQTIRFAGIEDPKATLQDVLDQMVKKANAPLAFDLNEKAFQTPELPDVGKVEVTANGPLPAMDASLSAVLKKVLSRIPVESGATYVIRSDFIEITTNAAVRKEFYAPHARKPLYPLVIGSFDNKPLDEALKELAKQTSENVILDPRTGKEGKAAVSGDFMNVPLDDAVFLLADMANLAVVRLNLTTFYVTSPRNAQAIEKRRQKGCAEKPTGNATPLPAKAAQAPPIKKANVLRREGIAK
jgi:hypothetical protein